MITIEKGDMLAAKHDVIVNAVNCVGVMGAGVALAIRRAAGEHYFDCYRSACQDGRLRLRTVHVWDIRPRAKWGIVNFPTMHVPGGDVNPGALRASMRAARDYLSGATAMDGPISVGVPALGCGIGGFSFHDLIPIVAHGIGNIPDVTVTLYKPW